MNTKAVVYASDARQDRFILKCVTNLISCGITVEVIILDTDDNLNCLLTALYGGQDDHTSYYDTIKCDNYKAPEWHEAQAYNLGIKTLEPDVENVLFIHADEIVEPAGLSRLLQEAEGSQFRAAWLKTYDYILNINYRLLKSSRGPVLASRRHIGPVIYAPAAFKATREQIFWPVNINTWQHFKIKSGLSNSFILCREPVVHNYHRVWDLSGIVYRDGSYDVNFRESTIAGEKFKVVYD